MKRKQLVVVLGALVSVITIGLALNGCGKSDGSAASMVRSYGAASSVGDFAKWIIDSSVSPSKFSVEWSVADSTGQIIKTINASGTCGEPDGTYSYRTCTVTSSTDSNNITVNAKYHILEAQGTGLVVHPADSGGRGSGTGKDEIQFGFSISDCSIDSKTGDYIAMRLMPVSNPSEKEMLVAYRVGNNGFIGNVLGGGFSLKENGTSFQMIYGRCDGSGNNCGTFNGINSSTGSCTNGVISMEVDGMKMRNVMTPSGLMVIDGPQNFGGMIAVRTDRAATIDDLPGKSVIIFHQSANVGSCSSPDGCTDMLRITFGQKDGTGKVPITAVSKHGGTMSFNVRAASDSAAGTRFTGINAGWAANNGLAATYPQVASIPGLFYTDETSGGNESPTLLLIAKHNDKLMVIGDNTTRTGAGSCTATGGTCDLASGNFVGFEP